MAAFPELEALLQDWKNAQVNLQQTETELQDACQEKALLEEALLNPSHNLYTVPKRCVFDYFPFGANLIIIQKNLDTAIRLC